MFKKLMICFGIISMTAACGLETYTGGDLPTARRLAAIKEGDSAEKVVRVLGTPAYQVHTSEGAPQLYVYARNQKISRAFLEPQEIERDVYAYTFDAQGEVVSIRHLTLADARQVSCSDAKTPVQATELSVWQQLINNFGRYDAGGQDSSVRR